MFSSPAKRRKTSRASSVDASQTNQQAFDHNGQTSAHLPSFQLPTKASLVRSNREFTPQDVSRSPTKSPQRAIDDGGHHAQQDRGFGLRDRKALRRSLGSNASPMMSSPRKLSGLQFAVPPRRVSRKIMPSDLTFGSPMAKRAKVPESTQDNTLEASRFDGAVDEEEPNLDFFPSFGGLEEPELPPTPTQLGMEPAPGRPKGLLSSSPSTRHAKRARRRMVDTRKPSPSKLRGVDTEGQMEDLPGLSQGESLFTEVISTKQKQKRELSAELQQLNDEIAELQELTDRLNESSKPEAVDLNKLISLLTSDSSATSQAPPKPSMSTLLSSLLPFSKNTRRARQTSPLPTNPFSLQEPAQAKPYLTAFAPLVLTSHSNRVSASKSDSLREAHNLTFSAPPPFPPDMYKISVAYESDPETQSLVSVSTPESSGSNPSIPESLRHWLDTRSANPLLTLDVSGLCWGINRYWEAAISRAQIWTRLEAQHPKLLGKTLSIDASRKRPSLHSNGTFTRSDLRYLVSHIERSTMLFESTDKAPKLLLSCPVTIDEWTSEPQLIPEISVTASRASKKIEQESKKLFLALLHDSGEGGAQNDDIHAIVRATEGVLCSLFRS